MSVLLRVIALFYLLLYLSDKEHASEPDMFWGKRKGKVMLPEEERKVQDSKLEPQEPGKQEQKPDQQKQDQEKPKLHPVKDFSSTQMRIIHLDLKGAAPKVSYLEQVRWVVRER